MPPDPQAGNASIIADRRVHQDFHGIDVTDGAQSEGDAVRIVEADQPVLEIVQSIERGRTGPVCGAEKPQAGEREALRNSALEIAIESGPAMPAPLDG